MKPGVISRALFQKPLASWFRFLSSVRLAIPLLALLAVAVAGGTIVESRYNAELASMLVYRSPWFLALMAAIWVNVFAAALSRYPYQRRHAGFLITHLGLMILMIGSGITFLWGVDGQLVVAEGETNGELILPELALRVKRAAAGRPRSFLVARTATSLRVPAEEIRSATGLRVQEGLPFAERVSAGDSAAWLRFRLRSPMFDVTQELAPGAESRRQMGPAEFRLVEQDEPDSSPPRAGGREDLLVVLDAKGKELARVPLSKLAAGSANVIGRELSLVKRYRSATVVANKLREGEGDNPALELLIRQNGREEREVVFAKYPAFSLNPAGPFGLKLRWEPAQGASSSAGGSASNQVDFRLLPEGGVRVRLRKLGKTVLEQTAREGDTIATPWMGMQLTLERVRAGASAPQEAGEEVRSAAIPLRGDLPPAALRVNGQWIVEGEERMLDSDGEPLQVFFAKRLENLPFEVKLHRFEKLDYPGTNSPMGFRSTISFDGERESRTVEMNEPVERQGYVLYQSSYSQEEGRTISIFSVNRDPGRWVKYAGALILVAGILTFIRQRSARRKEGT